jgi:hypothetical protein
LGFKENEEKGVSCDGVGRDLEEEGEEFAAHGIYFESLEALQRYAQAVKASSNEQTSFAPLALQNCAACRMVHSESVATRLFGRTMTWCFCFTGSD